MEGDARYKVEHMGDAFVDMLEKVGGSLKKCCSATGECKIMNKVPDAAKASLDVLKKAPAAIAAPFGSLKNISVGNPFSCLENVNVCNPLDMMKKVPDSAKASARGVILTYDIHELRKKKEKLTKEVGERIVELRRESPEVSAADDESVRTLLLEIDAIDSKLDDYIAERKTRLYPPKTEETVEETTATEEETEVEAVAEEQAEEEIAAADTEDAETASMPEAEPEASAAEEVVEEMAEAVETATVPEAEPEASAAEEAVEETAEAVETETVPETEPEAVAAESADESPEEESGGIEVLSPELADEEDKE